MNNQILQGSAETHLRYGEKYYQSFVANYLLIPTVKGFWKSVNNCQSYERL